jgi:uncharacterized membrane protein
MEPDGPLTAGANGGSLMSRFEDSIEVDVPVRVGYDHWTRFEDFPRFMDGVESVVQRDDRLLDWAATVGGQRKEWIAEIVDQVPDKRIAWKSVDGAQNAGVVLFEPLGPARTKITLRVDAEPDGPIEAVGDALGFLKRQVSGDLQRFKEWVESEAPPADGWRGEIHGDRVIDDDRVGSGTPSTASDRRS